MKERNGEQLYEMLRENRFQLIEKHDKGSVSARAIRDAAIDIPLEEESSILHFDVEALYEVIGQAIEEQSQMSSAASETEDEESTTNRRLTTGRKVSDGVSRNSSNDSTG